VQYYKEEQTFIADHFKMLSNDVKFEVGCLAYLHKHICYETKLTSVLISLHLQAAFQLVGVPDTRKSRGTPNFGMPGVHWTPVACQNSVFPSDCDFTSKNESEWLVGRERLRTCAICALGCIIGLRTLV